MKGTIEEQIIEGYRCLLYLPQGYNLSLVNYPVIYINGEDSISDIIDGIEPHFGIDCDEFLLVSVQSQNWNDDYTPWPAPGLAKRTGAFGGCADEYIKSLSKTIKPFIDTHYRTKPGPNDTTLIGYSLGGLAALYSIYICEAFGKIGSLSGSLWYDGWTEFMASCMPVNRCVTLYLSLGKGEEYGRNKRITRVGDCTRRAYDILSDQLGSFKQLKLDWNNGGHFTDIPERYHRAIMWLMRSSER